MLTEIEPKPEAEVDDAEWHNGQGEAPDSSAMSSLQLAHRVVAKFPELAKKYQKFIGTAAVVSSALIVLASIAVSRRLSRGESAEDILASITSEEIVNAGKQKPKKPKNGHSDERAQETAVLALVTVHLGLQLQAKRALIQGPLLNCRW